MRIYYYFFGINEHLLLIIMVNNAVNGNYSTIISLKLPAVSVPWWNFSVTDPKSFNHLLFYFLFENQVLWQGGKGEGLPRTKLSLSLRSQPFSFDIKHAYSVCKAEAVSKFYTIFIARTFRN